VSRISNMILRAVEYQALTLPFSIPMKAYDPQKVVHCVRVKDGWFSNDDPLRAREYIESL